MGPVLLVGDSHAEGLAPAAGAVASALGAGLRVDHVRGATTPGYARDGNLAALSAELSPSMVWVVLGTNDVGVPHESIRRALRKVVSDARRGNPDARVALWAPPKMRTDPYATAGDRTRAIMIEEARGLGAELVDGRRYVPEAALGADGVHLTRRGYARWGERAGWESIFAARQREVPAAFLVALAENESGFDPEAVNPRSGAAGLFQATRINLADYNRRNELAVTAEDVLDPATALEVQTDYMRVVLRRLASVGVLPDWEDREFVGLVALAHNVGQNAVAGAIVELRAAGIRPTMESAASRTDRPERVEFARKVARTYFSGGPPPTLPAPGRLRRRKRAILGTGAALLLVGGVFLGTVWGRGRK